MTPDPRPLVVMTCGVAGSGKTTLARRLEAQGFVRLSVDQEVWDRFGRHGVDYPPERYAALSETARARVRERLVELVGEGRDVVLDLSLWRRADRDAYKILVEGAGGRWRLVRLVVEPAELRRRLAERAARRDADAAFEITEELLAAYLAGFEAPEGEGEEVLTPDDAPRWRPR